MVNLAVAVPFVALALAAARYTFSFELVFIFESIAFLNIFLGLFNMFPIPPLDGSKVLKWQPGIYVGLVGALVGMLILAFNYFIFF